MKNLLMTDSIAVVVNADSESLDRYYNEREAISRIYLANEPMHVIFTSGTYRKEFDVEKDDVIVTFYSDEFENRVVVAKSEDWAKNIRSYNERMEEAKKLAAGDSEAEGSNDVPSTNGTKASNA